MSRRELANTLRQLRLRARKTLEEAAAALEVSAATLSRIETNVRVPRARDVKDLCEFYGVTDPERIAELTTLVADAKESGWWETFTEVDEEYSTFIGLETAATSIEQFECAVIPGRLQTADYSRAYLRDAISPGRKTPYSDHDIEKQTEIRMRRQQLLTASSRLNYTAIIDESALRRPVGGPAVLREQLRHLLAADERPSTEIFVLPLTVGGNPGQQGGFSIMTLPQTQVSDVVYIDSLAGQLFLESPDDLERHRRVFAALRRISLDTESSQAALRSIMADL